MKYGPKEIISELKNNGLNITLAQAEMLFELLQSFAKIHAIMLSK